MTIYTLNANEMMLIERLRGIKPELQDDAARCMEMASYQVQPIPSPGFVPHVATEDDPIENPARQFAHFIIGYMALQGILTPRQIEHADEALLPTLIEALDFGAKGLDAQNYADFRAMCDHAEWGRRWRYRRAEKAGAS